MFDDGKLTTQNASEHPVRWRDSPVPHPQRRATDCQGLSLAEVVAAEEERLLRDYIVGHCDSCGGPIFQDDRSGSRDSAYWHQLCAMARSETPFGIIMATVGDLHVQAGLREPPANEVRAFAVRVLNHPDNSHPLPELQAALRRRYLAEALSDEITALQPITTAVRGLDPEAWRD